MDDVVSTPSGTWCWKGALDSLVQILATDKEKLQTRILEFVDDDDLRNNAIGFLWRSGFDRNRLAEMIVEQMESRSTRVSESEPDILADLVHSS